jgi:hypothetical protein
MRIIRLTAFVALWLLSCAAHAEPRVLTVPLKQRTLLTAHLVPDSGVRFTFPFVLDESDSYVPYTLNITNPAFTSHREPKRNYFVVDMDKSARMAGLLGTMFMTVAGYEITVELRTTNDLSRQYTDIVFTLTDDAREQLVQSAIKQRTAQLEQDYKRKFDTLDAIAEQRAVGKVGRLAISSPKTKGIKEESRLRLPGGDSILLFVDQVVNFDQYYIYLFDIEADSGSKGITILDTKLFSIDPDTKQPQPVDAVADIPSRVEPNRAVHGAITVLGSRMNPKHLMRLQVMTDKGAVEVEW